MYSISTKMIRHVQSSLRSNQNHGSLSPRFSTGTHRCDREDLIMRTKTVQNTLLPSIHP